MRVGEGSFMLHSLDTSFSLLRLPYLLSDTFNLGRQVSQRRVKIMSHPAAFLGSGPEDPSSFRKAFSHGLLSPGGRGWGEGSCMMWGLKGQRLSKSSQESAVASKDGHSHSYTHSYTLTVTPHSINLTWSDNHRQNYAKSHCHTAVFTVFQSD